MDTDEKLLNKLDICTKNNSSMNDGIRLADLIENIYTERQKARNSLERAKTIKMKKLLLEKIDRLTKQLDDIVSK